MTQVAMDSLFAPHVVQVATGREAPAVWVRAIRILRELSERSEDVVREVRLRRGLNIVWAPPHPDTSESSSGEPLGRIAGHTAGKTSFVRLLRYVLGDKHFANESVRRRIHARFPDGWVLAEVVVAGESWTVARPFSSGSHPFCARGASLDHGLPSQREPFQAYLDALTDVVIPKLPSIEFPDGTTRIGWQHVLQWLARDQECRFFDPVDWRHPASDSGVPVPSVDHRYFLVRAIMHLVTEDERDVREAHAKLLRQRNDLNERRPLIEHQGRTDNARMQQLLASDARVGEGLFDEPGATLVDQHRALVTERRDALKQCLRAREDAATARDTALAASVRAKRDVEEAEGLLQHYRASLESLEADIGAAGVRDQLSVFSPGARYCNVPLSEARDQHCPLATSRVIALDEKRAGQSAKDDQRRLAAVVEAHRNALDLRQLELQQAETRHREAVDWSLRAQTASDDARDTLRSAERDLAEIERLLSLTASSMHDLERLDHDVLRLSSEIDASLKTQHAFRETHRAALARLSSTFGHVVQRLLGSSVQGSVTASGQSLTLSIESNGDRDSAALSTVKVLAFDLMALTASIEGQGAFPRLLIHDGPREADLAMDIYQRLFEYGKELESASPYEPAFQYIVTTTTEPPGHLQVEPWTRLVLSGAVGESRLYGIDL